MTLRLTVRRDAWWAGAAELAGRVDGLVPVVKGNGYGFGRRLLAGLAAELADTIAVGTVHELDVLDDVECDVVVLTPTLEAPPTGEPILTVGRAEHLAALSAWSGRVVVKLVSPMLRYGGPIELVERAHDAGLDVVGVALHPPLAGDDHDRRAHVESMIAELDPTLTVWLSHLGADAYADLPADRRYRLRMGTALWHGDRSALHLGAEVLDVRRVEAGTAAGYRLVAVPGDGWLVMIGAGTAHGVTPLPDGRSPFHHQRRRMELLEPPHMHTSMAWVPIDGEPPLVGDVVDVQRPLHMTHVDEIRWR